MRLKDKVAIITGAGQGIGKAYASRFLDEGAKVIIAEINEERGKQALSELQGKGDVDFVKTDISSEESTKECARQVVEQHGRIDILVNNAALYFDIDNEDQSYEYLQRVFSVNQHGTWLMIRAVAPYMVEQSYGRIINQSSGAAYMYVMPPMGEQEFTEVSAFSYSQTKWGIIGLTKFLAGQLGRHNVTVNCIAPGVTMTEATKKIVPEEFMGFLPLMTAMQRTLEPEDLTGSAVFFASDDSALVTGQVLCVDAGAQMPA
jgi:3-oxoacyl-[acyl-carrier protein] reductase